MQFDFEDYPSSYVAHRSQGTLHDSHIAIASVNSTFENEIDQPARSVFLGLKLTGFYYNSPREIGNLTYECIVIGRLDVLATVSSDGNRDRPKIEELSLSCEFDKSAGADVLVSLYEPFLYNLQTIKEGDGWISPSESFITWRGLDNRYQAVAGVINHHPMDFYSSNMFYSLNPLVNHEFILTLTLTYSFDSSIRNSLSTSLYIAIKD